MIQQWFSRLWERKWLRRALEATVAVFMLALAISAVWRTVDGSSEFRDFRTIVQVSLVEGAITHDPQNIRHIRAYPPFFSFAWAPFGALPWGEQPQVEAPLEELSPSGLAQFIASAAFFVLLATGFIFLSTHCAVRAVRPSGSSSLPHAAGYWLVLLLSLPLMADSIARCETDMLVVMAIAGAMFLMLNRKKGFLGGALLGYAAAFKLTPVLFGAYLLCRRRWKALGGMAAAVVVCWGILPTVVWGPRSTFERHEAWARLVLLPVLKGDLDFIGHIYRDSNQSPAAALRRYLSHYNAGGGVVPRYVNVADLPPGTVELVIQAFKVLIIAVLAVTWLRAGPGERALPAEALLFATVPLGMLLLNDVSLTTHASVFLFPYAALVGITAAYPGSRAAAWGDRAVLAAFLLTAAAASDFLKELSVITAAMLVLFFSSAYILFRRLPPDAALGHGAPLGENSAAGPGPCQGREGSAR